MQSGNLGKSKPDALLTVLGEKILEGGSGYAMRCSGIYLKSQC